MLYFNKNYKSLNWTFNFIQFKKINKTKQSTFNNKHKDIVRFTTLNLIFGYYLKTKRLLANKLFFQIDKFVKERINIILV